MEQYFILDEIKMTTIAGATLGPLSPGPPKVPL